MSLKMKCRGKDLDLRHRRRWGMEEIT